MVTDLKARWIVSVRSKAGLENEVVDKHCRRSAYLTWLGKRGVYVDVDVDVDVNANVEVDVDILKSA
jgi:hypothetical protein